MRWIIRLLIIFIIAILVAIYGMNNPSYVSFFIFKTPPPVVSAVTAHNALPETSTIPSAVQPVRHSGARYDIRLTSFIVILLIGLPLMYMLARFLVGLLNIPSNTRRWRALKRERYGHKDLNEAILQHLAGRYSRAIKSARKAFKSYEKNRSRNEKVDGTIEFGALAYLLSAASAHRLNNKHDFDDSVEKALRLAEKSHIADAPDAVRLQQVQWLIEDNDLQAARAAIAKLDPGVARRIATLQMQLQIDRLDKAPIPALHTVKQLIKHKAYEPHEAQRLITELACEALDTATDAQQVTDMLSKLDPKDQKNPTVVTYAAAQYAKYNDYVNACTLIAAGWSEMDTLPPGLRQKMLWILDSAMSGADETWIKRLENAHAKQPDDPTLTYLTGRISEQHKITGRAQFLLEQVAQNKELPTMMRQRSWLLLAQLAEKMGEYTKANANYKAAALLFNSQ